jgi:hypothetical protein
VAVLGLACYATLAGLSVLPTIQDPRLGRLTTTAFVMLAILAAGASLWFIAVQVFAIGDICKFCMATDIAGITIGSIAIFSAVRWWSATRQTASTGNSSAGLMALRSAMPAAARPAPAVATTARTTPRTPPAAPSGGSARMRTVPIVAQNAPSVRRRTVAYPSLPVAVGGALAMIVVLIGGQIVFPAKTYDLKEVALKDSIELSGSNGTSSSDPQPTADAETRVAMRVPAEQDGDANAAKGEVATTADSSKTPESNNSPEPSKGTAKTSPTAPPSAERKVKFLNGKLTLDIYKHPLIGSPDAPHVVVEMISYDCPHCRKTHKVMKQALSRYSGQVALIVLIVPLEKGCNRLITDPAGSHAGACTTARMALGIAKLRSTSFARFHDWLMSGNEDKPPALDAIIAKAYSMADRDRLREMRESNELEKQIAGYVDLFAKLRQQNTGNKSFGLPVQILGDHAMAGSVEKPDDVFKAWEKHLGVKPR